MIFAILRQVSVAAVLVCSTPALADTIYHYVGQPFESPIRPDLIGLN
jgi:hypothetical protein